MNIPHYWARVTGGDHDPVPGMVVYGWSDTSVDDARVLAYERMKKFAEIVTRDHGGWIEEYPYPKKPLREEIVREWSTGNVTNVVTRNAYGSLVLNTDKVIMIDVDMPRLGFFQSIKRLFGGGDLETALFDKIRTATDTIGCSMRLYRTRAGYRGIVTDRMGEPNDAFSEELFAATGTDKQYSRLCRVQKSYRARLTPKHWRLGLPKPPNKFPREEQAAIANFSQWLTHYEDACHNYSTCTFLETFGRDDMIRDVAHVVETHDDYTGAKAGQRELA